MRILEVARGAYVSMQVVDKHVRLRLTELVDGSRLLIGAPEGGPITYTLEVEEWCYHPPR